jgi:hypothetical protein
MMNFSVLLGSLAQSDEVRSDAAGLAAIGDGARCASFALEVAADEAIVLGIVVGLSALGADNGQGEVASGLLALELFDASPNVRLGIGPSGAIDDVVGFA